MASLMGDDGSPTPAAPLDPAQIGRLLEASAQAVTVELEALGAAARWRPALGEWSANEALGHILEAERRAFNGRIRTILAEDGPVLRLFDEAGVAAERHDELRATDELLAEFLAVRADSLDLVRSLRPADLLRAGVHPVVGDLSVGAIVGEWVHHDRNHLKQILSVSQARIWAQMGVARRFVDPTA